MIYQFETTNERLQREAQEGAQRRREDKIEKIIAPLIAVGVVAGFIGWTYLAKAGGAEMLSLLHL